MEERIGLIDIGSNTIRLVIFGYNKKTGLNEILNIKTPARLSQYLTKSNEMYLKKMKHFTVTMRLHILLILKMEFLSISVAVLPKLPFSKISNLKSLTAFHSAWYHLSVSFLVIKHTMTKRPLKIWNSFYVSNLVS